ncbi:C40 family peptidase [Mucilaginibacter sabulilitoris]|uniref:C40 family peptidase n=1 Tax=Mucilaginibacter sabulilitoris TaxID=1173583 RepID=A0ABZ0TRJ0_9SPHI|nr:C40 family peptidase [Mucilaginibacter sabulilitoris]WPU95536.1 C40 family peptidase [Mucilaginibacter sabulilitoris]
MLNAKRRFLKWPAQKTTIVLLLLKVSFSVQATPTDSLTVQRAQQIIYAVKQKFAPDKRTEVANIQLISTSPLIFGVETTKPSLINEIRTALADSSVNAEIKADTLPDKALHGKIYGLANLSVTNNRAMPANAAEMVTQMLLGTPVTVIKKQRGYYLVRTPDGYLSWVEGSGVAPMDKVAFETWQKSLKIIYTAQYGHAFEQPTRVALPVSDLVSGDILQVIDQQKGFYKVIFPDQREGFVLKKETENFNKWLQMPNPNADQILTAAKTLIGVPYLWGGTSIKGVDCSGFTKSCYFLNGIIIPRDASQQALAGEEVDIYDADTVSMDKCLKNLKPGDLLFFSSGMSQGKQAKITHTAIYMDNGQFIQSAGFVKISSLVPQAANNDVHSLKRLVKARRMLTTIGKADIFRVSNNSYYNVCKN